MTKASALHQFFSGFGIDAFPASDVPHTAEYPWLTYELTVGVWGDQTGVPINLWYYGDSNAGANAKAQEISDYIGMGGKLVQCDGGAMWIKRGSPWCQSIPDPTDDKIKRRYINVIVEFLTQN